MRTIAKLVGCFCMLSFLAFMWLSHSGVLPGSAEAHGWSGFGAFVLAVAGWCLLMQMSTGGSHKMVNVFCFSYGMLLILNAVVYTFLRAADLIGPVYMLDSTTPVAVLVAMFYYILAIFSMFMMNAATEDGLV